MSLSRSRVWLVFTIVAGLMASLLVVGYLKQIEEASAEQGMTTVIVAAQKVPPGTRLTKNMLKTIQVPSKYVSPKAVTALGKAENQFTTVDLIPDQVIFAEQLTNEKTSTELPYKIPKGTRALTVAVNDISGVAGKIKTGYYVDVLSHYKASDKPGDVRSITLLQNVQVLAVGTDIEKEEKAKSPENVTLAVDPGQAENLFFAENIGKIKLILRPVEEHQKVPLKAITLPGFNAAHP